MKRVTSGWHLMRLVRLVLGLLVIWQAAHIGEWAPGLVGGLFVTLALTDTGCCGANACTTCNVMKGPAQSQRTEDASCEEPIGR